MSRLALSAAQRDCRLCHPLLVLTLMVTTWLTAVTVALQEARLSPMAWFDLVVR